MHDNDVFLLYCVLGVLFFLICIAEYLIKTKMATPMKKTQKKTKPKSLLVSLQALISSKLQFLIFSTNWVSTVTMQ